MTLPNTLLLEVLWSVYRIFVSASRFALILIKEFVRYYEYHSFTGTHCETKLDPLTAERTVWIHSIAALQLSLSSILNLQFALAA